MTRNPLSMNQSIAKSSLFILGLLISSTPLSAKTQSAEVVVMPSATSASATLCHPNLDPNKAQYIIGYGSLMETESRARTTPNAGKSLPIRVSGFERGWITQGGEYDKTTYLGIVTDPDATMNAVVYPVTGSEVFKTDDRETGYCRIQVQPSQFTILSGSIDLNSQVWAYASSPEKVKPASKEYPVVQSYVDIFIKGCMQIEEKFQLSGFTNECIVTTTEWPTNWVNDRIFPRRPFIHEPKSSKIDRALNAAIPDIYQQRTIE